MPRTQMNATQGSSTQNKTQTSQKEFSAEEKSKALSNTVRYMLTIFHTSKNLVKKAEIVKHCFPGNGRHYNTIIEPAKDYINKIYGYKVVEVETGTKSNITKQYFAVRNNKLPDRLRTTMFITQEQKNYTLLLMLTLSHIAGSGGLCPEDTLWTLFKLIKILPKEGEHIRFGDVKKRVLVEFTKHLYLETEPLNEEKVILKWGRRAHEEFTVEGVKSLIKEICSDDLDVEDSDEEGDLEESADSDAEVNEDAANDHSDPMDE